MKSISILETTGHIIKQEDLSFSPLIQSDYAILESKLPFPEYYQRVDSDFPKYFYFLIDEEQDSHEILRIAQKIKDKSMLNFYVSSGNIQMNRQYYSCIRLKGACDQNLINSLLDAFKSKNIKLFKKNQVRESESIIKLKKFFFLEELEGDIYLDKDNNRIAYFSIPDEMYWEDFVRLTRTVRNNFKEFIFDAAMGSIIRKGRIVDIVRIYAKEISPEQIDKIKEKYLYFLNHKLTE